MGGLLGLFMSNESHFAKSQIRDVIALGLQELHNAGRLVNAMPLLRIDNRDQAAQAPFQFDAATGQLHRRGCRYIPKNSRSALYGVWKIEDNEQPLVCPRCKPVFEEDNLKDRGSTSDLLYGLLSIIRQFGGVLQERGQEYRQSSEGRMFGAQLESFYNDLGEREKKLLDAAVASLDGLAKMVRDLDSSLNESNAGAASARDSDAEKEKAN